VGFVFAGRAAWAPDWRARSGGARARAADDPDIAIKR
jgi:hypothetical protein